MADPKQPEIEFPPRQDDKPEESKKGGTKKGTKKAAAKKTTTKKTPAKKKTTKKATKKTTKKTTPKDDGKIVDTGNSAELFKRLDELDEEQARNMVEGFMDNTPPFYVIHDEKTGELKFKETLSLIIELLQQRQNIVTDDVKADHSDTQYGYIVIMRDTKNNVSLSGNAYQDRYVRKKDGGILYKSGRPVESPFAQQIALSKANRNVGRHFIEKEAIKSRLFEWYKEEFDEELSDNVEIIGKDGDQATNEVA